MSHRVTSRHGFSLPDLIVVLALSGLGLGLGLFAAQIARAGADRAACAENFRKIGAGMHKFIENNQGRMPVIAGGAQDFSIFATLLPYLGHDELHKDLMKSGLPWYDPANANLIKRPLAIYQCPAHPEPERLLTGALKKPEKDKETKYVAAPTDYNAVNHITFAVRNLFPENHDISGALNDDQAKLKQITDGLSNTLFGIVEIADKPNSWQAGKRVPRNMPGGGGAGTWAGNTFNSPRGYSWDGAAFPGPCALNCNNGTQPYSFHPTGCNMLFADGSVRFMTQDLDIWVFYGIMTRSGGEILAPSDF
jgi:prepilin-type processing-associated H-X9-DG protein